MRQKVNIPLYIGSKNRPNFPMARLVNGATLLVEPQDLSLYKMLHGESFKIGILPENDKGFTYMVQNLLEQAEKDKAKYFMFCDDDIYGFKNRDKTPFIFDQMFAEGVQLMARNGYSQLMISFAGHNWYEEGLVKEKAGAWGCFIGKTEDMLRVGGYDLSLPLFSDWDMSAKLIQAGFKTACWYQPMFSHKMKGMKGGAEFLYKDGENTKKAIAILKERYGDAVREVEAHGQKEARFDWKKLSTSRTA